MGLLCQYGYGNGDKIEKGLSNSYIDGVVLSPRYKKPEEIKKYTAEINAKFQNRCKLFFDPQFYLCTVLDVPAVKRGKLEDYPYFEGNLSRKDLSNIMNVANLAQKTIEFQQEMNLEAYMTPTVMINDFNGRDAQIAINLAYSSFQVNEGHHTILVSLCIDEDAFKNREAMEEFLDSITAFDCDGFYVIIKKTSPDELIWEASVLTNIMLFLYKLSFINMYKVILGYSYLISLLFAACGNIDFASGWFKNLQVFSKDNYELRNGGRRPRPTYLTAKLLNSILLSPSVEALHHVGCDALYLSDSPFDRHLSIDSWNLENSCLHSWYVLKTNIDEIESISSITERCNYLQDMISIANENYHLAERAVKDLNLASSNHYEIWKQSIESFRELINE